MIAEQRALWQREFDEATEAFRIEGDERFENSAMVSAACGTGSRILVHVVKLGPGGTAVTGGSKLVSVMYPWKAVYPVNSEADGLFDSYLCEKFAGEGRSAYDRNGGDMAGVCMAIRHAVRLLDSYEFDPVAALVRHDGHEAIVTSCVRPNRTKFWKLDGYQPFSTFDEAAMAAVSAMERRMS